MTCQRITLKHFLASFALCTILLGIHPAAISNPLVSQPYLAGGESYFSSVNSGFENADSFILPNTVSITSVVWWGTDAGTDNFLVRLGSELGNWWDLSGTIAKTATANSDSFDRLIFQYTQQLDISHDLAAGSYFLSISQEEDEWYWTTGALDNALGIAGSFFGAESDWFDDDLNELSFQLIGQHQTQSVPEPGLPALLFVGMMGWIAMRRRSFNV